MCYVWQDWRKEVCTLSSTGQSAPLTVPPTPHHPLPVRSAAKITHICFYQHRPFHFSSPPTLLSSKNLWLKNVPILRPISPVLKFLQVLKGRFQGTRLSVRTYVTTFSNQNNDHIQPSGREYATQSVTFRFQMFSIFFNDFGFSIEKKYRI